MEWVVGAAAFALLLGALAMGRAPEGTWTRRVGRGLALFLVLALLRLAYRQFVSDVD